MKRKVFYLLMILLVIFPLNVFAISKEDYRKDSSKGKVIKVDKNKVHVSVGIDYNISEDGKEMESTFIENFDAKYKKGVFYITLKRSELNKMFKDTNYKNVWHDILLYVDYIVPDDQSYYTFIKLDYQKDEYTYTPAKREGSYLCCKFLEISADSISISGIGGEYQTSEAGEFILFVADEYPEFNEYPFKYKRDEIDFSKGKVVMDFEKVKFKLTIIEDEQIDLGNTENIIIDTTEDAETGKVTYDKVEKVDNFYAEYIDNTKMKYSWTMYDKNGKPVEIKNDTLIKIDDKDKQEEIYKGLKDEIGFWDDLADHIKVLSFSHDGDLNGTAKISLYVGDKFKAGDILTLYYYNPEEEQLELLDDELPQDEVYKIWESGLESYDILVDKDGYITIELTHCSDYLLVDNQAKTAIVEEAQTKKQAENKNETNSNKVEKKDNKKDNKVLIIAIISAIVVVVCAIICVLIIKKTKKNKMDIN